MFSALFNFLPFVFLVCVPKALPITTHSHRAFSEIALKSIYIDTVEKVRFLVFNVNI